MSGVLHGVVASLKAAAAAATDTFFRYVSLLLNTTSTNGAQNNTFLDASTNSFTVTRNGNTTQGSFTPYMPNGYWGASFNGAGSYLSSAGGAALNFGTGNFTVEGWAYNGSSGTINGVFQISAVAGGLVSSLTTLALLFHSSGKWEIYTSAGNILSTANSTLNQWVHFAVVRASSVTKLYINGTEVISVSDTGNYNYSDIAIGCANSVAFSISGYVSNLRVVNGTAVYTAAFTPPTAPLTAITNTSLLACQSNRFIDNSTNAFAITVNGNSRISKFSPFNPPASYDTATYGGSGYFDGAGDYLSSAMTASAFGTADFTVEGWIYRLDTNIRGVFQISATAGGLQANTTNNVALGSDTGSLWRIYANGSAYNSTATWVVGTWYHFALVKTGGNIVLYINGTAVITQPDTTNYTGTNIAIGGFYDTTFLANGYISNARVVKGTAVYTANFTPPSTPLTAITNTSLLLNFTNGGIYDAASINDAETVGNAQVSTVQAKFGTTSMAFDGTGDWLTVLDKPELRLGTGAFTIEMWVYRSASGTYGLVSKGTATTGWSVSLNASNQVVFSFAASSFNSTGTVAATTWTYIAVVREGTGANQTKIYIDGTNDGTGTVSTDFNQTNVMYVGADRAGGSAFNGYIDELRITNGVARYTSNFTAPTAAFPTQ